MISSTSVSQSRYLGSSLAVASLTSRDESLWRAGAGVEAADAAAPLVSAAVAVPDGPSAVRAFAVGSGNVVGHFSLARSMPSLRSIGRCDVPRLVLSPPPPLLFRP